MKQLSRRSLAKILVQSYGKKDFSRQILRVAAHLVETRRTKSVDLLLKDIAFEAEKQYAHVSARVTSTHELTNAIRKDLRVYIQNLTNAKSVELIETIDTSLLGGVVIATPEMEVDLSLQGKLKRLKEIEI